jgi:hypothetical protein
MLLAYNKASSQTQRANNANSALIIRSKVLTTNSAVGTELSPFTRCNSGVVHVSDNVP